MLAISCSLVAGSQGAVTLRPGVPMRAQRAARPPLPRVCSECTGARP